MLDEDNNFQFDNVFNLFSSMNQIELIDKSIGKIQILFDTHFAKVIDHCKHEFVQA